MGSCSGVMDGHPETSEADLRESAKFLDSFCSPSRDKYVFKAALDCGAGIGRVAEGLLLPRCTVVDVLEPDAHLLAAARRRLSKGASPHVRHFLQNSLQELPALPDTYDLIWIQWVLLYLTDEDLVAFLIHAKSALRPSGHIVVKENCMLNRSRGKVDLRDASLTRSDARFRELFAEANLTLVTSELQEEWPASLLPVMMYALR